MKRLLYVIFLSLALIFPSYSFAIDIGAPFGGFVTSMVPCTCGGGLWFQYTPFFFGSTIPTTGSLYIPLGAVIYEYFQLAPGTWQLGSYVPGTGECFIAAPNPADPCIFLPAEGTVEYTGTSSLFPVGSLFSGVGL